MDVQQFQTLMKPITDFVAGKPVDKQLEDQLNRTYPPGAEQVTQIEKACHAAIEAGWMCTQGAEGRRFGRVIEAGPDTNGMSVDVVDLKDIVGPHHRHPTGEICLTMPVDEAAKFDGQGAGWQVNPPGSAHNPTVSDGRALVLYLLPDGKIEFTKQ